jgi:hypothetical protein
MSTYLQAPAADKCLLGKEYTINLDMSFVIMKR